MSRDLQEGLLWRVKPVILPAILLSWPSCQNYFSQFSNSPRNLRSQWFSIFVDSRRFTISTIARALLPSANRFSTLSRSFHTARQSSAEFSAISCDILPLQLFALFKPPSTIPFVPSVGNFPRVSTILFIVYRHRPRFSFFTIRRNFWNSPAVPSHGFFTIRERVYNSLELYSASLQKSPRAFASLWRNYGVGQFSGPPLFEARRNCRFLHSRV